MEKANGFIVAICLILALVLLNFGFINSTFTSLEKLIIASMVILIVGIGIHFGIQDL